MKNKVFRHLELISENVTQEEKKYYRSYIYKDEHGNILIDKREINQKTFKDTTEKKSFTGVIHSSIMAAHNLLDRVHEEKDLEIIRDKAKQLNHYIDKLIVYCDKHKVSKDELSELLTSAASEALLMTKNENNGSVVLELLQKALDELVNNSKLKHYYIETSVDTEIE